jgi:type II secretory pathway component GspD/PulD (secretin)
MSYLNILTRTVFGIGILASGLVQAQEAELLRLNPPNYEAEASKLRSQPTKPYEFSKAVLGDVIRFMATDAGLSFFSLPEGSPEADRLITFSLRSSPFQALETLTKANGLTLILDGGIWYVRPADDKELIGKAYEVKNNSMERIIKSNSAASGGSGGGSSGGGASAGGASGGGGASSGGGGGGGGVSSGGVDLQGAQDTFQLQRSEMVNDLRAILDLPNESSGSDGTPQTSASGGSGSSDATQRAGLGIPTDMYGNVRKPKVIWKSDSNTLYIVATRLQHMWVEGYLSAADKPQSMIAIEVKFIETSRDPSSEFGIDWSNTLGQTGTFFQPTKSTTDPTTGVVTVTGNNISQTSGGFRADLTNLLTINNLAKGAAGFASPTQAILSAQDLSFKLRAMLRDQETKTTSYPRMVTTNNREVVIRSVVNQPVLGGSSSSTLSGGQTTNSSISYLPIGTVINILPKKMHEDKVNLNIAITVSSIIGTEVIQGNPYPIATSRVYSAPVEVDSGYTVAVGGLDEAKEQETDTGVPILNKIPIIGYAFKSHGKTKNHKNLMIFITPRLIDSRDGGLPDRPEAVVPRKPERLMPKTPRLTSTGGLEGGVAKLPEAIAFMQRSADELGQTIKESRGTDEDRARMTDLQKSLERLDKVVDGYITEQPAQWQELNHYKAQITKISSEVSSHRRALFKKGYY